MMARRGVVSVQVLNEVATVALRKLAFTLTEVMDVLDRLRAVATVVPLTLETHDIALRLRERHGFAICDCTIIAAACSTIAIHCGPRACMTAASSRAG